MNIVSLTGRAAKEIELKFTGNGTAVASGTIAVQRNFKNANGEYEADFINFVAWRKTAELMAEYIKKGEHFGITGRMQVRHYENNEGKRVYVTEVVVNDFDFPIRPKGQGQSNQPNTGQQRPPQQNGPPTNDDPFANQGQPINISDQDLPF